MIVNFRELAAIAGDPSAAVITTGLLADVFGVEALVDHARDGKPFVIALRSIADAGTPLAFGGAERRGSGPR